MTGAATEQEMITLLEHLASFLVFIECHIVLVMFDIIILYK